MHHKSSNFFMVSEKSISELSLNFWIVVSWTESIVQNDSLWIPSQTSRIRNSLEDRICWTRVIGKYWNHFLAKNWVTNTTVYNVYEGITTSHWFKYATRREATKLRRRLNGNRMEKRFREKPKKFWISGIWLKLERFEC